MLRPGFVQPVRDIVKQHRENVDHQDREERAVQADRDTRPEKIVPHNHQQNEQAWNRKTVIHHFSAASPNGDSFPEDGPAFLTAAGCLFRTNISQNLKM